MTKKLTYEELLQENLELRQSIEELRKYYKELSKFATTINESKPALTDEEREAIEWYANFHDGIHRDTLLNLLEKTKDK